MRVVCVIVYSELMGMPLKEKKYTVSPMEKDKVELMLSGLGQQTINFLPQTLMSIMSTKKFF